MSFNLWIFWVYNFSMCKIIIVQIFWIKKKILAKKIMLSNKFVNKKNWGKIFHLGIKIDIIFYLTRNKIWFKIFFLLVFAVAFTIMIITIVSPVSSLFHNSIKLDLFIGDETISGRVGPSWTMRNDRNTTSPLRRMVVEVATKIKGTSHLSKI